MQRTDLGHGRGWLDRPAAESVWRIDDQLGFLLDINSAGRTWDEQQQAWNNWQAGVGAPANLPGTSVHESGRALDTDHRYLDVMTLNGWWRPYDYEPWHFEYDETKDKGKDMLTQKQAEQLEHTFNVVRKGVAGQWSHGALYRQVQEGRQAAQAAAANTAALTAAVAALATSSGVDPDRVTQIVEEAVKKALDGLTLTLEAAT